jgi:hypothetical protein
MLSKLGIVVDVLDDTDEDVDEEEDFVEGGRPMYAPRLMVLFECIAMSDGNECLIKAGSGRVVQNGYGDTVALNETST